MNKKQIAGIFLILIGLGLIIFLTSRKATNTGETALPEENNSQNIVEETKPLTEAWDVWTSYLSFIQVHDTKSAKNMVSELSPRYSDTCLIKVDASAKECDALMDAVYKKWSKFGQASFPNKLEDSKQVILSTNYKFVPVAATDRPNDEDYEKDYLFFVKDENGNPKFLDSYQIVITFRYKDITKSTKEEKAKRVADGFIDADKDGLLDRYEDCKQPGANIYKDTCSTSSSQKKDSVGDGWWDSTRTHIKH